MSDRGEGLQLLQARYVVPVVPAGTVLEHHTVVVENSTIRAVLPSADVASPAPGATRIDLPDHVLLPGLINTHTHSPMSLLRGFADDMDLHVWLEQHIWPAEKAHAGPGFVADGSRLAIAEMIRGGTTCFNDMYFFPDATISVCEEVGMRAVIGIPVIEIETPWAAHVDEYLDKGLALVEGSRDSALIDFAFAPHAPYTVSDDTLGKVRALRDELGIPVHIHLLETKWDIKHSTQHHGMHPLLRLQRLGLLDGHMLAVHMTQLTSGDIDRVAASGLHVVHCPQSNLKLASGICPLRDLLQAGVNVALGTDGAASNNDLDLLAEAQSAALLAKGISGDASAVSAFEALEMLTINGARALGKASELGSIEVGKKADLCAVDLSEPETQPLHNVVSQLIYAASRRQVSDVWIGGRRLLQEGRLTTIDLQEVLNTAGQWRRQLARH